MTNFYFVSIGTGTGVFYVRTSDPDRVRHEIRTAGTDWTVNIWLMQNEDTPIKRLFREDFI